jgi:type II secretory pathway pseudopilin PulG
LIHPSATFSIPLADLLHSLENAMTLIHTPNKLHRFIEILARKCQPQPSGDRLSSQPSQQGLSILECLIAVAVLGLTAGLVLPPLVIASATRVQTRRAEQALQLAQGEVDRVRVLVERNEHLPARLPAIVDPPAGRMENVPAPGTAYTQLKSPSNCNSRTDIQVPANRALLIDVDGDCQPDFMMQTFRTRGSTTTSEQAEQGRPSEFQMGVRVYSIAAGRTDATRNYVQLGGNLTGLQTQPANLSLTSSEGRQLQRPLAVLYTHISWGDQDSTLCNYFGDRRNEIESCQDAF